MRTPGPTRSSLSEHNASPGVSSVRVNPRNLRFLLLFFLLLPAATRVDSAVPIEAAIVVEDRWSTYDTVRLPDDARAVQVAQIVEQELSQYSPHFLRAVGLKKIWLARSLKVDNTPRAAVILESHSALILDVATTDHRRYLRHTLHHELYHLVELHTAGDFYFKDPKWAALNPPNSRYGNGGASEQDSSRDPGDINHPAPGFVSRYAMSGLEEDKAEIFACLHLPEERALLDAWTPTDRHLAAKVKYVQGFITWWSRPQDQNLLSLLRAIHEDDAPAVEQLCKSIRAITTTLLWNDWLAPHLAAARGATRSLPVLAKYADINTPDLAGWTPLHTAAAVNDAVTCHTLLNLGADPKLKDKSGQSAIDRAATPTLAAILKSYR